MPHAAFNLSYQTYSTNPASVELLFRSRLRAQILSRRQMVAKTPEESHQILQERVVLQGSHTALQQVAFLLDSRQR